MKKMETQGDLLRQCVRHRFTQLTLTPQVFYQKPCDAVCDAACDADIQKSREAKVIRMPENRSIEQGHRTREKGEERSLSVLSGKESESEWVTAFVHHYLQDKTLLGTPTFFTDRIINALDQGVTRAELVRHAEAHRGKRLIYNLCDPLIVEAKRANRAATKQPGAPKTSRFGALTRLCLGADRPPPPPEDEVDIERELSRRNNDANDQISVAEYTNKVTELLEGDLDSILPSGPITPLWLREYVENGEAIRAPSAGAAS